VWAWAKCGKIPLELAELGGAIGFREFITRSFGLQTVSASNLFLMHEPASSNERVSEETCWRIVPVYRAITMIANDIGRLPFHAAVRESDGDLVPVESGVIDMLADSPHRYIGSMEFRRTLTNQALRYGNAFAAIVRNGRGDVLELVPMLPGEVQLHSRVTGDLTELYYTHHREGRLAPEDVLHLKAPGNDGLWGESPIRSAREALGLMRAMEKTGGRLYAQAGVPKLALVHPGALSPAAIQSIADSYQQKHAGADNAGKPLVLGEGMRIEKINQSLEDQMWQQAREFSVQEVSRLFGVPVVYLSEHSRSTFASITELTRGYWDGCLAHWTAVWSEEVRRKLLAPGQHLVWDTRDLLKGSFSDQVSSLRSAVEAGLLTRNEARQRLGLPTLPGLDEPLTPANTLVAAEAPDA
jgi:HK97 family phage portal protein